MKLTYRDKILLIGAVVVIIWAIGIFVIIRPAFATMNDTSRKKDSKDNEVITLQERVDSEKNLMEDLQKAYDDAVKHSDEFFYKVDTKEAVTDNVRELLKTSKREIVNKDYSIDDISLASVTAYGSKNTGAAAKSILETQADVVQNGTTAVQNKNNNTVKTIANTVSNYRITTDYECKLDEIFDFADTLLSTDQQSFIIQSINIEDVNSDTVTGDISFNYYMAPEIPKPAALVGDDDKKDEAKDDSKEDK